MKCRILLAAILLTITSIQAQSLIGVWKTVDEKTNKPVSEVEFYEQAGKYYGKIVKLYRLDSQAKKMSKEEYDKTMKSTLGMVFINELSLNKKTNTYENGYFKFPNFDKKIDCQIEFAKENRNKINVEAKFGIYSKTLTWERVK